MKAKFNLRRYLRALSKKKIIIIVVFIVSAALGVGLNLTTNENVYSATSKVYCSLSGFYLDKTTGTRIVQDYSDIVTSKKVADKAAVLMNDANFDGERIQKMVKCTYSENSPVYKISVTTTDPEIAIRVSNAVASAFVTQINILTSYGNAQILDEAYEYKVVYDGRKDQIIDIVLFALIGTFICVVIILISASYSKKVETVDDVTLDGEIEILGVIPNFDVE